MGNIALWLAARFVPGRMGMRELQVAQARLMAEMACTIIDLDPERGRDLLRQAFSNYGRGLAEDLKPRFHPGATLSDLTAVWRAMCNLAGIRLSISQEGDRVVFEHPFCPLWEEFRRRGRFHCQETCLPMITALSQAIAPSVEIQLARAPDSAAPCIKALSLEEERA